LYSAQGELIGKKIKYGHQWDEKFSVHFFDNI
jgi:hypothetical protein